MKEAKFIAWDVDNKKWLNMEYLAISPESGELLEASDPGEFTIFDSTNYILLQSTGFKDKNGIELYEDAVIEWAFKPFGRRRIDWDDKSGEYRAVWNLGYEKLTAHAAAKSTYVGSALENPELLQ